MSEIKGKVKDKKLFICSECGTQLSSAYNLKIHVESKCSTVKKYICEICNSSFLTSHSKCTHLNTVHAQEKKFVCSHCAKSFASKGQLTVHERSHTKEKIFSCNICGKAFAHRESLVTHSTTHTNLKPYACENCQKTFSCIGNLIKHRKVRPTTCGRDEFKIQKVNKRAGVKIQKNATTLMLPFEDIIIEDHEEVYQDVLTYDQLEDPQFIVIPTSTVESTIQELHIEENHKDDLDMFINIIQEDENIEQDEEIREPNEQISEPNEEIIPIPKDDLISEEDEISEFIEVKSDQKYYCKLCPKIYQKKNISIKHLKKEHNIVIQSFIYHDSNQYRKPKKKQSYCCKYCPKKFISQKLKARHEIVHGDDGTLIHKCSCCSLYFADLTELENHQHLKHEDRLNCKNCNKKFDQPEKLLSHKKYAHAEKNAVTKKYVFVCTLCGRNFNTKVALSDHERSNCGTNPIYKCKYCEKKYHSAGSLKCHTTIHTLEMDYACDHCPKRFRTKGQLQIHHRSHTKFKPFKCNYTDCNASFSYRESLLTHLTVHTGIKRFQCEHCCAQFSCISNLLAHRKSRKQKDCRVSTKIQKVQNALTTLSSIDSYVQEKNNC